MGILLGQTPEYAARKANLSPARQRMLAEAEEEIASDPDRFRIEVNGVYYLLTDNFVAVGYRRLDRNKGQLVDFTFYEDA